MCVPVCCLVTARFDAVLKHVIELAASAAVEGHAHVVVLGVPEGAGGASDSIRHDKLFGLDRLNGLDGSDGIDGLNGLNGIDGLNGRNGLNGTVLRSKIAGVFSRHG